MEIVELSLLQNVLIALALGALVGLEREYAQYRKRGHDYAGIRTFPLIALFGFLAAFLGDKFSIWLLIVSLLLIGALVVVAYFTLNKDRMHIGATSEVAGFLTFFIGVLTYYNEQLFAVALAVLMAVILYSRSVLHHFAQKINPQELSATLKFAVIAFVILPFLPNKSFGPYEMFNPYIFWLMVVFILGLSFVGYILVRIFGQKGITLTGILGGIVSSTALTTSFAQRSRRERKAFKALVLGVVLANSIMFIRVLVEVFVLNRPLFVSLLVPMLALFVVSSIFAYFLWRDAHNVQGKIKLSSPFTFGPALKFGLIFAAVLALVKVANVYLSAKGIYIVSFLSGIADVDAITVSLSQLAQGSLSLDVAKNGIIIAALTNTAVKGGIAWWFGSREFKKRVVWFFVALVAVGIGLLFL